jgi:3-isopropylmalate/(R)-2-methylmalate dehydratase small subunit
MQPFLTVEGPAASLLLPNVDTDVIMPKQFLKGIDRAGLDAGALHDLRFDTDGRPRPDFVLNRPPWQNTRFLVVGPNFGCGSSREHAVWGLMQLGVRAVLGTSYAGIFADNAANNGLLLITLSADEIAVLAGRAGDPRRNRMTVDLEGQMITGDALRIPFTTDPQRRHALMHGLDSIGSTLEYIESIKAFQITHLMANPWLA